jgi:hypothetical protein
MLRVSGSTLIFALALASVVAASAISGRDGIDTLMGLERLEFSDSTVVAEEI